MFGSRITLALARGLVIALALTSAAAHTTRAAQSASPADLVLTGGKIYTVDGAHRVAEAIAVKAGKVVFVGPAAEARRWIGSATLTEQLGGHLVLPGLIDSHIHPLDILDLDVCNLDSKPLTLRQLSGIVSQCLTRYQTPPGQLLVVHQWNYAAGNQPSPRLRRHRDTIRRSAGFPAANCNTVARSSSSTWSGCISPVSTYTSTRSVIVASERR